MTVDPFGDGSVPRRPVAHSWNDLEFGGASPLRVVQGWGLWRDRDVDVQPRSERTPTKNPALEKRQGRGTRKLKVVTAREIMEVVLSRLRVIVEKKEKNR